MYAFRTANPFLFRCHLDGMSLSCTEESRASLTEEDINAWTRTPDP